MQRIVTVTSNAALDWTCFVADLRPGARNIVRASSRQAGGKGVNVARVLANLGVSVRSMVVVGGRTGEEILRDLEESELGPIAIHASGESRTCLEVIDETTRGVTQLHGVGVHADANTASALVAAVEQAIDGATWLAVCGSLAPGFPIDLYATLIRLARSRGVPVALDASGAGLIAGLDVGVDLLRINRDEAVELGHVDPVRSTQVRQRARKGILSNGDQASVAWSEDGAPWRVRPPLVSTRNAIGCGDTMLAGILARMASTSFEDALRFATALASASAECRYVGEVCMDRALELMPEVEAERVDQGVGR